jgi:hypothetical protein
MEEPARKLPDYQFPAGFASTVRIGEDNKIKTGRK